MGLQDILDDATDMLRASKATPAQPLSTAAEIRILAAATHCPRRGEQLAVECATIEDARGKLVAELRRLGSAKNVEAAAAWRATVNKVNAQ